MKWPREKKMHKKSISLWAIEYETRGKIQNRRVFVIRNQGIISFSLVFVSESKINMEVLNLLFAGRHRVRLLVED